MGEFENHTALIQILSKKLKPENSDLPEQMINILDYLVYNHLILPFKGESFYERVTDIYMELLEDCEIPTADQIEDVINEENICIIDNVLESYGYCCNDIDSALSFYYSNCACVLNSSITETLKNKGLIYLENSLDISRASITPEESWEIRKDILDKKYFPQRILFYEFLY